MFIRLCNDKSCPPQGCGKPHHYIIHNVPEAPCTLKGVTSFFLSGNHKTFIAGETFLLEMQQDPAVQEHLSATNIRWKHQTPRSPWMGGHFERLVQTIKASLATTISRKLLTLEEFSTIVKEAENIVNLRPLTYQSDTSRDFPLIPPQLAWGRDLTLMPPLLMKTTTPKLLGCNM